MRIWPLAALLIASCSPTASPSDGGGTGGADMAGASGNLYCPSQCTPNSGCTFCFSTTLEITNTMAMPQLQRVAATGQLLLDWTLDAKTGARRWELHQLLLFDAARNTVADCSATASTRTMVEETPTHLRAVYQVGAGTQLCRKPDFATFIRLDLDLVFAGGAIATGSKFTAEDGRGSRIRAAIEGTSPPSKCGGNCP